MAARPDVIPPLTSLTIEPNPLRQTRSGSLTIILAQSDEATQRHLYTQGEV